MDFSTEEYCRYKNQRTDGKQTFLTFPEHHYLYREWDFFSKLLVTKFRENY